MTRSSVKPISMFIILSMFVCEAPTFDDMPNPLKVPPGTAGIVCVVACAEARADADGGDALMGKAVVVRGLLTRLLPTEPAPLSCGLTSRINVMPDA